MFGILNVTPDSFSDGGRYISPDDAIAHAIQMVKEGADWIDIGAESTRPGAEVISADEEWTRLAPVLTELVNTVQVPVSVDTYKVSVAEKALSVGSSAINDIWGGLSEPGMLDLVASAGCQYIWMNNRPSPSENPVQTLMDETNRGIEACLAAGIRPDCLWIDPGIGFGKTHEGNLAILKCLSDYTMLGFPVFLGTSRKRVVGNTLQVPADERVYGSLATVSLGVWAGCRAVRVHDVLPAVHTCRMVEAIRDAT